MDEISIVDAMGRGQAVLMHGTDGSRDAVVTEVRASFPGKPYCLVEDWWVFKADLTSDELLRVHSAGHLPLILFAHRVVEDSQHRFHPGDWVRSSMCRAFSDGVFFETRNTVYVLLGQGHGQTASLKAIFSFF